ncbi:MAG TPA: hypothetical protein VEK08_17575 [Planctomycetota bacterium]|nr:hypothetical protein [Planctomycetota bacterium]
MKHNLWAWVLGFAMIGAAIYVGASRKKGTSDTLQATQFGSGTGTSTTEDAQRFAQPIEAKNGPAVIGFVGDLVDGGFKEGDGSLIPFVIGDIIKLDAEAVNAVQYRWTVNGSVIKDKNNEEWSTQKDREYVVERGGDHKFAVQVRGTDPNILSQMREVTIKTVAVFITSFDKAIVEEDDRCLTGEEYTVEVTLADPITAELDFFELRYLVNDVPVKHPDDGKEWTIERSLGYQFPAPGQYSLKVEVRRKGQTEVEASATLAETIVVADAVLLTFDAFPDKYAPLGTTVALDCFPDSIFGKSECRFGVKKVVAADFEWIADSDGSMWGAAERNWLPTEPGNYIIRAEVREIGKPQAEDFRELLYTVTLGDF